MSIEIESEDVIRLVLQFLKENEYQEAAKTLEQETNVKINTIENKEKFIKAIKSGEWDTVLLGLTDLKIPAHKLIDLYEQVVLELAELRELGAARSLLRQTEPMFLLKQKQPERYLRLEHVLSRSFFDPKDVYSGTTKEKRRNTVAQALANEVPVVEPARLMTLLEDCVRWQQHQGLLPLDTEFDLFKSSEEAVQETEEDAFAQYPYGEIKLPGKNTYAECTTFSPNGLYLVSGSVDGFIEVWNYSNGKLRKDLKYQAEENLMAMDQAVLCLNFSSDSELLASGSTDGKIAIWRIQTGSCSRKFSPAHSQGVTSICFNKDSSEILSCSFDSTVKIHNLKSGKLVTSFEGHTSFVNSAIYSNDNTQIISASSDETVKIWDLTTGQCLYSLSLDQGIKAQLILPSTEYYVIIQSNHIASIINDKGKIVKTITGSSKLISGTLSPQSKLLYTLSEDSMLNCFDLRSGEFKGQVKICKEDVIGMSSHPFSNIVAVNNEKRRIYLYSSSSNE